MTLIRVTPEDIAWAEHTKLESKIDPIGMFEVIPKLKIKRKKGGIVNLGDVANPVQMARWAYILHKRRERQPIRRIEIKIRQLASMSTTWGAAIWADCSINAGMDAIVTANRPDSVQALSRMYRRFAGEKEDTKVERRSDKLFRTKTGSYVALKTADEDLGRSDSITHAHISEADYIDGFNAAYDSFSAVMPELDAWWSMVVMETTTRRGMDTEFRAFVDDARAGHLGPWDVDFTAWFQLPELSIPFADDRARMKFIAEAGEYERMLALKLKLPWEKIQWWKKMLLSSARGRVETMQENYPSTIEEALALSMGAEFFHDQSIKFYESCCCEPQLRYLTRHDGMRITDDPREYLGEPHVAVWEIPTPRHRYVIGADGADAEIREDFDRGSECYAVVLDMMTGEQVAEWHGNANAQDFAVAISQIARHYNHALVVPEVNASNGMIDHLMNSRQYTNVYERESFGHVTYTPGGVYGFMSNAGTRPRWVQRLQDNFNGRALMIRSAYLLKQLVGFGKRRGRPQKRQARGLIADDGVVALGMCMFGHDHAVNGTWRSKDGTDVDIAPRERFTETERATEARSFGEIVAREDERQGEATARMFLNRS